MATLTIKDEVTGCEFTETLGEDVEAEIIIRADGKWEFVMTSTSAEQSKCEKDQEQRIKLWERSVLSHMPDII